MSAIQQQVSSASDDYSASFTQGHLALPPAKQYLVLTCMDARIDTTAAFGIGLGDAHVIRNVSFLHHLFDALFDARLPRRRCMFTCPSPFPTCL